MYVYCPTRIVIVHVNVGVCVYMHKNFTSDQLLAPEYV